MTDLKREADLKLGLSLDDSFEERGQLEARLELG